MTERMTIINALIKEGYHTITKDASTGHLRSLLAIIRKNKPLTSAKHTPGPWSTNGEFVTAEGR